MGWAGSSRWAAFFACPWNAEPAAPVEAEAVARRVDLEATVAELQDQIAELRREFEEFKKQF